MKTELNSTPKTIKEFLGEGVKGLERDTLIKTINRLDKLDTESKEYYQAKSLIFEGLAEAGFDSFTNDKRFKGSIIYGIFNDARQYFKLRETN